MDRYQIEYYEKMKNNNRRIDLFGNNNELIGIVTFFIVENRLNAVMNREPWTIIEDEEFGHIVYIDQIIGDKKYFFSKLSFEAWKIIKEYFFKKHPNIDTITWNRWKNDKLYHYTRRIRDGLHASCAR